nr:putative disease resistance rpp13-like protein 1 [Quercus suber]
MLVELPSNMGRLVNLHCLDVTYTWLEEMPLEMGKLRNLQNLSISFVGKDSGSNIRELGELRNLFGTFCISNLKNVDCTKDATKVNLKEKKNLSDLELEWGWHHETDNSENERNVLEQLRPHTNLESLSIHRYRVLSLSLYKFINVLPNSIGNLKHLRYLKLNGTKIKGLPDSVCSLYNLQTLLLRNYYNLKELPTNMGRLVNLRHLDIRETCLIGMPINMGKLKSLQNLSAFYVGKGKHSGTNIKELGKLPHLSRSLCISNLENVYLTKDVEEVNLKDKKGLLELKLEWGRVHENYDSKHERDVLE